jgi:hypothetical protein
MVLLLVDLNLDLHVQLCVTHVHVRMCHGCSSLSRRFWWRNGSETARPKCAPLWTSGPILWAADAHTTAPSFGRFLAVPLS